MPIYEYECALCKFRFEKKQQFHEEPVAKCPICEGKVNRVLHPTPIIFKGSGFYTTDNRKGGAIEETGKREPDKKQRTGK